ncbi:MAG: protein-tyrosine-phosphatase [Chitinophagales bacterium]|jgi:protein-tyrosine-phosphatase
MPIKPTRLLFVCTGNTCRSQMAHAIATEMVKHMDKSVDIISRGVLANPGTPTTADALTVLAEQGIEWLGTSRQLEADDVNWADHVWVMTQEHLRCVQPLAFTTHGECLQKIELLLDESEILDPLGLGIEAYQALYIELFELLPKRLATLPSPSLA